MNHKILELEETLEVLYSRPPSFCFASERNESKVYKDVLDQRVSSRTESVFFLWTTIVFGVVVVVALLISIAVI